MYFIEKTPMQAIDAKRPAFHFNRARDGFKAFLKAAASAQKGGVLLPAYIGWSSREGSGVFDPVAELALPFEFYRMDRELCIDLSDLEAKLRSRAINVVVLIHYFGFIDPGFEQAVSLARQYGAFVLEDEAHSMLTDVVGGISGRLGDACIYSLHKQLPVSSGGILLFNRAEQTLQESIQAPKTGIPWEYDLKQIADKRIENAATVQECLRGLTKYVRPLRKDIPPGVVPHTYPVIIETVSRDRLYFMMNEAGYGVVSLYHTMISQIEKEDYPLSHELAARILNLPIHQDVGNSAIQGMMQKLSECIELLLGGDEPGSL